MEQQRCCVGGCRLESDDTVLISVAGNVVLAPICASHAEDVRFGDDQQYLLTVSLLALP